MRRLFLFAAVAAVLGCGSDSIIGPVQTVDGQWTGTQSGYNMSLNMTQTDTVVTGSVAIIGVGGALEGSVTGSFKYPNLSLTIVVDQFEPVTYTGTMSQTQAKIVGRLDGSGFNATEIDVARH